MLNRDYQANLASMIFASPTSCGSKCSWRANTASVRSAPISTGSPERRYLKLHCSSGSLTRRSTFPMCLCWANENWSRQWDGRAEDVLIGQQHSADDDLAFIAHVAPYLRDPRYLRMGNKPMLLVYRPGLLPDPRDTAQRWRVWCRANGVGEIHLAYVQSFDRVDPRTIGFDSAVEFPPNNTTLKPITSTQRLINPEFDGDVFDWRELAESAIGAADPAYPLHPGVNPSWDNEARRSGRGRIFAHASPRRYRDWLRHAVSVARRRTPDAPLVFVNAWNEWAEGAVLEPDRRLGHAWLEATRSALQPRSHRRYGQAPLCRDPCLVCRGAR